MSLDTSTPIFERVCYVHCNFCNTILAVSVPCTSVNAVTVRCGHCANLLSVNMGTLLQTVHLQELQSQKENDQLFQDHSSKDFGSSSKCNKFSISASPDKDLTTRIGTEKKQRVPSAYNRFIKEEIQRIKASNPDISHREAFSTAAKNWAHFPHIHFGLAPSGSNKAKFAEPFCEEGNIQGFY